MNRHFITLPIPPFEAAQNDTMDALVLHAIYVEFTPGDSLIAEMCVGGGRTWVDLSLDLDLVLSSSGTIFGENPSKLVNPKIFEKYLKEQLSSYGNTGVWELYRQYAEAVYSDTRFDQIPERKEERLATWQKYLSDYDKSNMNRRVA